MSYSIYNYKDTGNTFTHAPYNAYLVIETPLAIYYVSEDDPTQLWKYVRATGVDAQLDVDPDDDSGDNKSRDRYIQAAWLDRANTIIYFGDCDNDNVDNQYDTWSLDYSTDTVVDISNHNPLGLFDIGVGDVFLEGADLYVLVLNSPGAGGTLVYKNGAEPAEDSIGLGEPSKVVKVGTKFYFICDTTPTGPPFNVNMAYFDTVAGTITLTFAGLVGYNGVSTINFKGIAYDNNDIFYFLVEDRGDGDQEKWGKYSITDNVITVHGNSKISFMLNRFTDSTNDIPFDLEKGFDNSLDANNRAIVYQISKARGNLYAISRLSLSANDLIVSITDNYLIVDRTGSGGDVDVYQYIDFITYFSGRSKITAYERKAWKADLWVKETGVLGDFEIFDGLFLKIIGSLTSATVLDTNAVIYEGYARWSDIETPRKIWLDSPAKFDLKNKTTAGEYSGRTDQIISDLLDDFANYITGGTMSAGGAQGDPTERGRKSLKTRINGYAQYDKFIWVIQPDNGQGLLHYNNGAVDSGVDLDETDKLGVFKAVKMRNIVNQVNLKGAMNFSTGAPYESTKNNFASQQIYNVQPIYRTFANINTQAKLDTQAQSILDMEEDAPFKYTFTKKIGSEGLVLPSETITLSYSPKSVASGERIIQKLEFFFRRGNCKWTVVDAVIYTSDMDILIQDVEENSDLIEQNAQAIHNLVGGLLLYLQDDASGDIGGYKQLTTTAPADALATSATPITGADQEIEQWATESGVPSLNILLSGILEVHYHAWVSAGTKDIRIYFKLYKRTDPGGVETELLTTEESELLPGATAGGNIHGLVPETELDTTDRLVLKLFANPYSGGSTPTLSFSIEGTTFTRAEVPAPIGSLVGFHAITSSSHTANNWKVWYSDGAGAVQELALGAADEILTAQGAAAAPTFEGSNSRIATGTYTGNGNNNRQITGLGFTPKIWVVSHFAAARWFTDYVHEDFTVWDALSITADATFLADRCKIIADGFEVNNNEASDFYNVNALTYYYWAFG